MAFHMVPNYQYSIMYGTSLNIQPFTDQWTLLQLHRYGYLSSVELKKDVSTMAPLFYEDRTEKKNMKSSTCT